MLIFIICDKIRKQFKFDKIFVLSKLSFQFYQVKGNPGVVVWSSCSGRWGGYAAIVVVLALDVQRFEFGYPACLVVIVHQSPFGKVGYVVSAIEAIGVAGVGILGVVVA